MIEIIKYVLLNMEIKSTKDITKTPFSYLRITVNLFIMESLQSLILKQPN